MTPTCKTCVYYAPFIDGYAGKCLCPESLWATYPVDPDTSCSQHTEAPTEYTPQPEHVLGHA